MATVKYLDLNGLTRYNTLIHNELDSKVYNKIGLSNGIAQLDSNGKVPSSQLPSYVDDVLEFNNFLAFPETGENGKIYVDVATNTTWRWSGTAYVQIKGDLVIGTITGTAADGAVVDSHISNTNNPHSVTKAQVGLENVENKSSETIRGELTSSNVTTALGYTPYNSSNPLGYTSNIGTVTGVKLGASGTTYNPTSGIVTLPEYPEISNLTYGTGSTLDSTKDIDALFITN